MLLQERSAVGLRTRFNPARDRLAASSRRESGKDLRGDAERFLRDMAFALTLTHRVKRSIFAERRISVER
jgi:hypothetical protein